MTHLHDAQFIDQFACAVGSELQTIERDANSLGPRGSRCERTGQLLRPRQKSRLCPRLSYGRHRGPARIDSRRAAVAIVIYPHRSSGQLCLTLTRRPTTLSHHGGQVCLPGGRIESGESPTQAALREYEEELGVKPEGITEIGCLSPIYVFASDNWVETIVMTTQTPRGPWRPDPVEVDQVIEMPLSAIANLAHQDRESPATAGKNPFSGQIYSNMNLGPDADCDLVDKKKERSGKVDATGEVFLYRFGYHAIEFVDCDGHRREVWGATAMLLEEFAGVIGRAMVGRP